MYFVFSWVSLFCANFNHDKKVLLLQKFEISNFQDTPKWYPIENNYGTTSWRDCSTVNYFTTGYIFLLVETVQVSPSCTPTH
jgi:hypothetical protein